MPDVDLTMLGRLLGELADAVNGLTDQLRVQGAMTLRLDAGQSALLAEVHAMHQQMASVLDRLDNSP